jgi:hypothetical protein
MNINTVTYSAALFRADFVARSSRIPADMLLARASSAQKSLAACVIVFMFMTTKSKKEPIQPI